MYLYAVNKYNKSNCIALNKGFCNNNEGRSIKYSGDGGAMINYAERLKYAMQIRGVDQSELARRIGVKPQAIQYLCKQGKRSVHSVRIANELKINPTWLTDGVGEMETTKASIAESLNAHGVVWLGRFTHVPVTGAARLVNTSLWGDIEQLAELEGGSICYPTQDKDAYAIRCDGDALSPRYKDGEFIIIEPNKEHQPGDEVFIKRTDGKVMIKIFLYERDDRIHLMAVNDTKETATIALEEVDSILYILGGANKTMFHSAK
jgi:phage repressor protein C with HTH and peptisase S24 domain